MVAPNNRPPWPPSPNLVNHPLWDHHRPSRLYPRGRLYHSSLRNSSRDRHRLSLSLLPRTQTRLRTPTLSRSHPCYLRHAQLPSPTPTPILPLLLVLANHDPERPGAICRSRCPSLLWRDGSTISTTKMSTSSSTSTKTNLITTTRITTGSTCRHRPNLPHLPLHQSRTRSTGSCSQRHNRRPSNIILLHDRSSKACRPCTTRFHYTNHPGPRPRPRRQLCAKDEQRLAATPTSAAIHANANA